MKNNLKTISTRMDNESLEYINKLTKTFNLHRSTALRLIFKKGLEIDKQERALEMYIKGKLSLGKAAEFADMHIGDFLELMGEKGVNSNLTLKDFKDSLKNLDKIWKK